MQSTAPNTAKSLIPVRGRPFIDWQLEWLHAQGVRDVILCIGHLGESIRRHVGTGKSLGVHVTYVDEGDALKGTAGALRLAVDELNVATPFYVLYGDSMLDISVEEVTSRYQALGLPALMTVFRNEGRWEESNAIFNGQIITTYEKHAAEPSREMVFVDYGLLIIDSRVVRELVPPFEVVDLADVLSRLSATKRLSGFEAAHRFFEIGTPEGLRALESHLKMKNADPL
jgi:NDP-sugar pyrophosphorylase family protein